jgi:hypothetical protein
MENQEIQKKLYDRIVLTVQENCNVFDRPVMVKEYGDSVGIRSDLGATQIEALQKEFRGYVHFLDGNIVVDPLQ